MVIRAVLPLRMKSCSDNGLGSHAARAGKYRIASKRYVRWPLGIMCRSNVPNLSNRVVRLSDVGTGHTDIFKSVC